MVLSGSGALRLTTRSIGRLPRDRLILRLYRIIINGLVARSHLVSGHAARHLVLVIGLKVQPCSTPI